jgi:hypothetical protein
MYADLFEPIDGCAVVPSLSELALVAPSLSQLGVLRPSPTFQCHPDVVGGAEEVREHIIQCPGLGTSSA